MEILRRAIEQLSAPICTNCNVEMRWARSALMTVEQAVAHVFTCAHRGKAGETKRMSERD